MTIQSDGKIVVLGQGAEDFVVARYLENGTLDAGFGQDGIAIVDFGDPSDVATSVTVDSQDRIVVAGYTGKPTPDFVMARLTADGALDTSFAGSGKTIVDVGGTDRAYGVAVDSQDRVVAAGTSAISGQYGFAAVRWNTDGTPDETFGTGGTAWIDVNAPLYSVGGLAVDDDDRLVVVGSSRQSATKYDFAAARLTSGGLLDSAFGGTGIVTVDFGNAGSSTDDYCQDVSIDTQGRIVIGGFSPQPGPNYPDFAVARLLPDGSLDPEFDADGRQTIHLGSSSDYAYGIATDGRDRIALAGRAYQPTTRYDLAVVRLTETGAPDTLRRPGLRDRNNRRYSGLSWPAGDPAPYPAVYPAG